MILQPEGSISVGWLELLLASESQLCASLSNSMVSLYLCHGRSIYTVEIGKYYQSGLFFPPLTLFSSTPLPYFKIMKPSCQDCYTPKRTCHRSHNWEYFLIFANTHQHFFCAEYYTVLKHYSPVTLYYTLYYSNFFMCINSFNLHSNLKR